MRIALQTYGTAGDIRPVIALGAQLVQRGHVVTMAATCIDDQDYAPLCRRCGVEYLPVPANTNIPPLKVSHIGYSVNPVRSMLMTLQSTLFPFLDQIFQTSMELCTGNDAIVSHFGLFTARAAAQKTGIPQASITFWPGFMLNPSEQAVSSAMWKAIHATVDAIFRPVVDDIWRRAGLARPEQLLTDAFFSSALNLVAASPLLYDASPSWPASNHLCGWFAMPPVFANDALPPDLQRFLDAGEPPVFITFGSLHRIYKNECDNLLVNIANNSSQRMIIQSGHLSANPAERIFYCGAIPHSLAFANCAAAVVHGGAGTIHSVVQAGVPSVTIAFNEEQFAWGQALFHRGLGGRPFRFSTVTAEQVVSGIEELLNNTHIKDSVRHTGISLRQENGTLCAAKLIEMKLKK